MFFAWHSNRHKKYIYLCSAKLQKRTDQFQGFPTIYRYKVNYWGAKMTKKNIEYSSCSKEGCLQSIEQLKIQLAVGFNH